ncbi:MAG: hypothetical protein H7222_10755 [Methylotenera sp.]|nr:hypothetical protein [Oligoflexia bacterium]
MWLLLSSIYSLTAALILQGIFENLTKFEISLQLIWLGTVLTLFIPAMLERISAPVPDNGTLNSFTAMVRDPFIRIYLKHDLRRLATLLTWLVSLVIGFLLPEKKHALWVLAAQLPLQRALFSVHKWRTLAIAHYPRSGAEKLITSLWASQTCQLLLASLGLLANPHVHFHEWLMTVIGAWGGIITASSMCMEGDSGRPWLVNFITLAAGTLAGFLCFYSPWFLAVAIYFSWNIRSRVEQRLHSVEHLDEDSLLS